MAVSSSTSTTRSAQPRRPIRVLQLMQYYDVGGIERMVLSLSSRGRQYGLHSQVAAYLGDGALRNALESAGIQTHFLATAPGLSPSLPLRLVRLIREQRFDVVHTHHLGPYLYGGLAARMTGVAHVHTEHSRELYDTPRRRWVGRSMAWTARVVAVAPELGAYRRDEFSAPCEIIRNGVNVPNNPPDGSTVRTEFGIPEDAFVVGCVARLAAEKDHPTLLTAFSQLTASRNAHLIVVGDGPEAEAIDAQIRALKLDDRVHRLGRRSDIDRLLPAFDVICLSSTREGLPLALLEGMGVGRPAVATAVGGIPDLLASGGGLTVPPSDAAALSTALAAYADDPGRRQRDGARARELVQSEYSLDAMVGRYASLYRLELAHRRRRRLLSGAPCA